MGGSGIKKSVSVITAGKKTDDFFQKRQEIRMNFYSRDRELSSPLVGRNFGVVYF